MNSDRVVTIFIFASFFWLGIWVVFYPTGVIGWAKKAHPQLREDDARVIFYARFIGSSFIVFSIIVVIAMLGWS
jgi:hypothetical protein